MASDSAPPCSPLNFIEEVTRNVDSVQERVLHEILSQNSDTEYLTRYGLGNGAATDRATFKSKIPAVPYEDIQSEIARMVNGDKSKILCSRPTSEFIYSTGTSSGKAKLFPMNHEEMDCRKNFYSLMSSVMKLHCPNPNNGKGKGLYFALVKAETKTASGIVAQMLSTSFYKSGVLSRQVNALTSPIEAVLCLDAFQSIYTQLLCGLLERGSVIRIGSFFASGLVRAISFFEQNWQDLVTDIATGKLNPRIVDPAIKARMAEILKPDPSLAEFLATECGNGDWKGIVTRIWPNATYLNTVVTGTMSQYVSALDYYSDGLPKVSMMYSSSECFLGINLTPMCDPSEVSYTLMPHMAYFEFIPEDIAGEEAPRFIDLNSVEIRKEYEIVVTTYAGLYRYCMGDVLRVTGFHNSAPQFRFVRRKNVLLQAAIGQASSVLSEFETRVVEYTSCADVKTIPGHYVVYLELLEHGHSSLPCGDEALERCCLTMEESLSAVYRRCRAADGTVGPLEIRVVKSGTFEKLMEYAISGGASVSQYKVPRCVNTKPHVELL